MNKLYFLIGTVLVGFAPAVFAQSNDQARPCRGDAFYVDVPLALNPQWSNAVFLNNVAVQLAADANSTNPPTWFCGADATTCPPGQVSVKAEPLLRQRSDLYRTDGHLRFFRIWFEYNDGRLVSRPGAACSIVSRIRQLVALHAGVAVDSFYVGRECDASAMSAQGAASQEMLEWHVRRVGLPSSSLSITAPPLAEQTVDLTLIDSGVLPSAATTMGLSTQDDYLSNQPGLHGHGTGMAVLSRHVAPNARLHSARALEAAGSGTSASLALALDDALYATSDPRRPLVLNLSLGWPSELGRAARLVNGSCSTVEDPFGEPVRYLLHIARRLDLTGSRKIFTVAAAGNQPLSTPSGLFPPPPTSWTEPSCTPQSIIGTRWFYPAHWHRLASCTNSGNISRVALGVGAVDDVEQPSGVAIANSEPALVAPGQLVYASLPGSAPQTPVETTPQCGATSIFPPQITLPRAFTGTSVSAVMVSAAAARAQYSRLRAGLDAFNGDTLARLLYLTGRNVCRVTPDNVAVRRLDVGRLDSALTLPACRPLIACAQSFVSAEPLPSTLLNSCRQQLASCGLEQLSNSGTLIPNCPSRLARVPWPASYSSPRCSEHTASTTFLDAALCGSACPFADDAHRSLVGSLGPTPNVPACPDCPGIVHRSAGTWSLRAELSADYPVNTGFGKPFLIFQGPELATGTVKTFYVDLTTVSPISVWVPGAYLHLNGTLTGAPNFDWSATSAKLSLSISIPGAVTAKDISALRLTVD